MSTNIKGEVTPPPETGELTDTEFLDYCETHADSPRCGFVPEHLHRLLLLAGMKESAQTYAGMSPRVMDCDAKAIKETVESARHRLRAQDVAAAFASLPPAELQ